MTHVTEFRHFLLVFKMARSLLTAYFAAISILTARLFSESCTIKLVKLLTLSQANSILQL